jgi:CRP-like cAMP-binding protein
MRSGASTFDSGLSGAPIAVRIDETVSTPLVGPTSPRDLARFRLFSGLQLRELDRIFAQLKCKPADVQDDLNSDGKLKNCVSFAWSGHYRITIMSPTGSHVTIRTVQPGGHFGEIAAFSMLNDRAFSVIVDEPGVLLKMPAAVFRELVASIPALREATMTCLAHAAVVRADRIYEFATLDMKLRLHAELLRLGTHKGRCVGDVVIISPAPTQDAIATQIGATREGVTRQMKCLVEHGLVQKRRREIVLLDIQRLQALVERNAGFCISHKVRLDFS